MEKIRIRDGKIRIRDKHPGSATLLYSILCTCYRCYICDLKIYGLPSLHGHTIRKNHRARLSQGEVSLRNDLISTNIHDAYRFLQCCGAGSESRGAEIKLPPEMLLLNGIFSREFLGTDSNLLRLVFVWVSTLIFLFYKILFTNRLEFSSFSDFFCEDLKNQRRVWFSSNT
jgi:hypothetical protein